MNNETSSNSQPYNSDAPRVTDTTDFANPVVDWRGAASEKNVRMGQCLRQEHPLWGHRARDGQQQGEMPIPRAGPLPQFTPQMADCVREQYYLVKC